MAIVQETIIYDCVIYIFRFIGDVMLTSKILLNFSFMCAVIIVQQAHAENKNIVGANTNENFEITISARVKFDEKIGPGVHMFNINCGLGRCGMDIVSINECMPDQSGNISFKPIVQQYSTWAGTLQVVKIADDTFRLTASQPSRHATSASILFTLSPATNQKQRYATAFEAKGFLNFREDSLVVPTVDYVPISSSEHFVPIDCPLKVQGLSSAVGTGTGEVKK